MTATTTTNGTAPLSKQLTERFARIKLLVLDVDGVLTDGSIYLDSHGNNLKCFFSHDGHGIKMILEQGVQVMLLSARKCNATRQRAGELGIPFVHLGEEVKRTQLYKHMQQHQLGSEAVAYMGDDLVDLGAMQLCGLVIAPVNAVEPIRQRADIVTSHSGGRGAVRECCDQILKARGVYSHYLEEPHA